MEGKARFIFPVIISALIVFVVSGVVTFTNIGLRADFVREGKGALFEKLEPCLIGGRECQPYAALAADEQRNALILDDVIRSLAISQRRLGTEEIIGQFALAQEIIATEGRNITHQQKKMNDDELRAFRAIADTAVYTSSRREITARCEGLEGALALTDAIVAARRAA